MAITNLDQLIAAFKPFGEDVVKQSFTAEVAGILHSTLYIAGRPGAANAPSPGMAGAALTSYPGQIPVPAPVGGQNIYLARLEFAQNGGVSACTVYDRLWHNSGIVPTTTTAQTVNSVTLPARDQDGATLGNGIMAGIEVSAATTNSSAITTITMSYTNSAGVSGRTATIQSFPATAVAGTFVPFSLAATDVGIRSIQSITLGTSLVTGTVHLVMYREMASIGSNFLYGTVSAGPIELGLPRFYDNSVPYLIYVMNSTSGGTTNAQLTFAQG